MVNVSHWWQALGGAPARRPPLDRDISVDVAIIGGGFSGLWTAISLLEIDPSLNIAILEREYCGFGASGRNGGWVQGDLVGSRQRRAKLWGNTAVANLDAAIAQTVDHIGAWTAANGIECDFHKAGTLTLAQNRAQQRRLEEEFNELQHWRPGEQVLLDRSAVRQRVQIDGLTGGLYRPACATIHPAKLVAGLVSKAQALGVQIYESTEVQIMELGPAPILRCTQGSVLAAQVVQCTEGYGWLASKQSRAVVPINSAMIATEPLPDGVWNEIGWSGREALLSGEHLYKYLQRTADGRIAIGGRGVPYLWGSRSDREGPLPQETVEQLKQSLVSLFGPTLQDVSIEAAWHGVLGVPRDWQPRIGYDRVRNFAWAGGYSGEGVAASNLAGRSLAQLILGQSAAPDGLAWVCSSSSEVPRWEPEPLRYMGIRTMYRLLGAADARDASKLRSSPALAARIAGRLSGL